MERFLSSFSFFLPHVRARFWYLIISLVQRLARQVKGASVITTSYCAVTSEHTPPCHAPLLYEKQVEEVVFIIGLKNR